MDWSQDMDSAPRGGDTPWGMNQANLVMDIHGDPVHARLVVFSDGNHHMALRRAVAAFKEKAEGHKNICFLTTPPGPLVKMVLGENLVLGNLILRLVPHVFISPPHILDRMVGLGMMTAHRPFCRNRGSVLLVKKSNPRNIRRVSDLAKPGLRLFLSSPETEKDSRSSYEKTLTALSGDDRFLSRLSILPGKAIHHREALEAVDSGSAHGAMLFYHLARHYTLAFPDRFETVYLGRTENREEAPAGCPVNTTHAGIVKDGGPLGQAFINFLFGPEVRSIYRDCGLVPLGPSAA